MQMGKAVLYREVPKHEQLCEMVRDGVGTTEEGFCSSSLLPYAMQGARIRAQASAPHPALCRVCQPQGLTPGREDCWGLAVYIKIPKTWLPLKGTVAALIIPTSEGLRGMGMVNYKPPGRQPISSLGSSGF